MKAAEALKAAEAAPPVAPAAGMARRSKRQLVGKCLPAVRLVGNHLRNSHRHCHRT
jgi:hypothetical protein